MKYFFLLSMLINCNLLLSQSPIHGYVLEKKDNRVYIDIGAQFINIGDRLSVIKDGGVFIHPVTNNIIKKESESIAFLEVIEVKEQYSVSRVNSFESYQMIQIGMRVNILEFDEEKISHFKKNIIVQPLTVSNIQGYLGIYISDVLTGKLLEKDYFRVLDHNTLGINPYDFFLSSSGLVSEAEFLKFPNVLNADYIITGTMYEPDVVEVSSEIPVKNLINLTGMTISALSGKDLRKIYDATEFVPDRIEYKNLRAIVRISLKVIDVKTGEVLFICSEMQEAAGRSEIHLEGGVLEGIKIRGGASAFENTITGIATKKCIENLLDYVIHFFNGKITSKNYTGNIVEFSRPKTTSTRTFISENNNVLFVDQGVFRLGTIIEERTDGKVKLKSFDVINRKFITWVLSDYYVLDNNKSIIKLRDTKSLDVGSSILITHSDKFIEGRYLSIINNKSIEYEYINKLGHLEISNARINNIYKLEDTSPLCPYYRRFIPSSTCYFYNAKERRIIMSKVLSNLDSDLSHSIEYIDKKEKKVLQNVSTQDIYPLDESFDIFKINDAVRFANSRGDKIYGRVVGYRPITETLHILDNSMNLKKIYYKNVERIGE